MRGRGEEKAPAAVTCPISVEGNSSSLLLTCLWFLFAHTCPSSLWFALTPAPVFSLWERQFINVQRGSSFGIKGTPEWSFQNTWTLERVIHTTAFYKNVTEEVGNCHLKRLPVVSITTLFAEGVQRGSAGERCCRNEGPDRPLVLCPTWLTITPQVVLLRTPGLRASAVSRASPSYLNCAVCRNPCAILFIFSSLVYYSFFFLLGLSYSSSVLKLAFLFHRNI